jgi:hypothetical protein
MEGSRHRGGAERLETLGYSIVGGGASPMLCTVYDIFLMLEFGKT